AAGGLEVVAPKTDIHRAARDARVLALHGGDHLAERDAGAGESLEVDRDTHFGLWVGPGLGAAHARRCLYQLLEVLGLLAELAPVGGLADECHLDDVDRAWRELAGLDRENVGRKRRPDQVELTHHLVVLAVGVRAVGELDFDQREAVERRAVESLDVLELRELVLDRVDDEPLDVFRVGARVLHQHQRAGELEGGVLRARDRGQGPQARRDEEREHDERELPALDRERPEAHRGTQAPPSTRTGSLSSSQAAPSVTTWSPSSSPAITSMRSPRRRPVRTETFRATPPLATTKTVARRPSASRSEVTGTTATLSASG